MFPAVKRARTGEGVLEVTEAGFCPTATHRPERVHDTE